MDKPYIIIETKNKEVRMSLTKFDKIIKTAYERGRKDEYLDNLSKTKTFAVGFHEPDIKLENEYEEKRGKQK